MKIYSYYAHVPELNIKDEHMLAALWRRRWLDQGAEPIILTEYHARKHLRFDLLDNYVSKLPSRNAAAYERACYLRWLALGAVGGGWMSDLDVIPYGNAMDMLFKWKPAADICVLQARGVSPSLVFATPEGVNLVANEFMAGRGKRGEDHFSDQYVIEDMTIDGRPEVAVSDVVRCFSDLNWEQGHFVHYANAYMMPKNLNPRWKHIPLLRK